jgi:hypothetical protein
MRPTGNQLACCSEARTCRQTCAWWLPQKRQQVRSPNQWLWAWAAHSTDGGWNPRLEPQRMLAYLPAGRGCRCPVRRAPSGRGGQAVWVWTLKLFCSPRWARVVAWRLEGVTRDVLTVQQAAALLVFFAARAGLPCTDEIALLRASSSCFSITPTAGGHRTPDAAPATQWTRGSTLFSVWSSCAFRGKPRDKCTATVLLRAAEKLVHEAKSTPCSPVGIGEFPHTFTLLFLKW